MKAKKKLSYNTRKQDLPVDQTKERLERILGTKVSPQFLEWYRQDYKPGGFTTPGLKYQGPGNPTNIGDPVNYADSLAEKHDLQYAHAQYKYESGQITKEQFEKRIARIDREFLAANALNVTGSFNPLEQVSSVIGTVGIGLKYGAERVIGQQYPSTEKGEFTGPPKEEGKLATKLFTNLKNNVSTRSDADQSSSSSMERTPSKRPASPPTGVTPTKKGTAIADTPNQPPPEDIDMASLTGTAKDQASGGASSDGMMVHYIEKPISIFGRKTSTYTKSHKFMTFGLAPAFILTTTGINDGNYVLTSYLAEVPWHIPALYLNQSEFDLIPAGSKVTNMSVQVIYRGSTIQFETNTSTSSMATLNQINDIAVAHALNRTGWGSNVRYKSFNDQNPMLPTGILQPTYGPVPDLYRGMARDYYGSDNTSTDFVNDVPKHQVGRQTFLYNYWVNSSRGNTPTDSRKQFGGWPCLAGKITQMDGKTVVNQVVASSIYKPKFAPIKAPLRMQGHGLPFPIQNETLSVPGLGTMVNQRQANVQVTNVVPSSSGVQATSTEANYAFGNASTTVPTFNIYTPIEKSQYGKSGFWGVNDGHIQPSLHIGVQPVPALSTASTTIENQQFNRWTDTRAYWEVIATMEVEEYTPTEWPTATVPNIPAGETITWAPTANRPAALTNPRNDGATFAGLYTLDQMPIS